MLFLRSSELPGPSPGGTILKSISFDFIQKLQKHSFWRGFEPDGARISGFFKLQKIRTGKSYVFKVLRKI
jgi:hypothetical protein